MKRLLSPRSLLLLYLLSSSAFAAETKSKDAKPKKSRTTSLDAAGTFEIESTVKGLSIVKDGILAGSAGQPQTGKVGMNEIIVSAPNHATRKVRFWIERDKKKTVVISMKELANPVDPSWKTSFKKFDPLVLGKKSSLCSYYVKKSGSDAFCDRKTLLDDIIYSDDSLYHQEDLRDLQTAGQLGEFRLLLAEINKPEIASRIEDLLNKHPKQKAVFHLASFYSLLRGDCPRVQNLWAELSQYESSFPAIEFHMAVCAEAQNDKKLRDKILADGMKDKKSIEALAYWAGLNALQSSTKKANEYALICLKSRSVDTRCTDLANMLYKLEGKSTSSSPREFEDPIFKIFMKIQDRLPKGSQESLFLETASISEQYPLAIEPYLMISWINAVAFPKVMLVDQYAQMRTRVSGVKAGSTLEKATEALEKDELTQLLSPIYTRRLSFFPEDPNLWYRLIRSYAKGDRCEPLLKAFDDGAAYLPKYNPSLLQMRGSCEMELKSFDDAVVTYKKVNEVNPKTWSSPYNLANAYERAGKKVEAYGFFKKTLELNPPADVKQNIEGRLKFLKPK